MAALSYLDFFPAVVQRTAVSTAATMAQRTSSETFETAVQALPKLLPLLEYPDQHLVDSAALALSRITSAAARCASCAIACSCTLVRAFVAPWLRWSFLATLARYNVSIELVDTLARHA